jgi:hypothetical protein
MEIGAKEYKSRACNGLSKVEAPQREIFTRRPDLVACVRDQAVGAGNKSLLLLFFRKEDSSLLF